VAGHTGDRIGGLGRFDVVVGQEIRVQIHQRHAGAACVGPAI